MIFNIPGHIEKIISGEKTQTRRLSNKYEVGKTYAIQSKRGVKAIPEGRIRITGIRKEFKNWEPISHENADAEGQYSPKEYEKLYEKMYPNWTMRYVYYFMFEPILKSSSLEPVIRNIRRTQTDIIFTMPKNKEINKNE